MIILFILCLTVLAFVCIYFTRLKTIRTIEKITACDDGFDLYAMTVRYDYSTESIIKSGFSDTAGFINAVIKESLPLLPVKMKLPSFGCSVYRAFTPDGTPIMGRNYDFSWTTSSMLVRCNPKNGYSSIGFAALNNIAADKATASIKNKLACLTAPFICLDGINEKGVAIAVLTLDSEPVNQNTGRDKIATSLVIRLVLDHAASTQEAVDLLRQYDMMAVNGRDYHFFISDASGDSRIIEYDCEDESRPLIDTPCTAITNFFAIYIDKVKPDQKNGIYGHGRERYDRMVKVLDDYNGIIPYDDAFLPLQAAASLPDPDPSNITCNTQWSIVFDNKNCTADFVFRRRWEEIFRVTVCNDSADNPYYTTE